MHEYSSVSSSASDITMASTPCVSSSLNWNLSISSSSEEEDAIPSLATASPRGTCWIGCRLKEHPVGLDDRQVEGRGALKS